MSKSAVRDEKKPYAPPELRTIELLTGEVLGTNCKTDFGGGEDKDETCAVGQYAACLATLGS